MAKSAPILSRYPLPQPFGWHIALRSVLYDECRQTLSDDILLELIGSVDQGELDRNLSDCVSHVFWRAAVGQYVPADSGEWAAMLVFCCWFARTGIVAGDRIEDPFALLGIFVCLCEYQADRASLDRAESIVFGTYIASQSMKFSIALWQAMTSKMPAPEVTLADIEWPNVNMFGTSLRDVVTTLKERQGT